jgi:hypothetical protein
MSASTGSEACQSPLSFPACKTASPAGCIRPSAISRSARALSLAAQACRLRDEISCILRSSSSFIRRPSIQPCAISASSTASRVTKRSGCAAFQVTSPTLSGCA